MNNPQINVLVFGASGMIGQGVLRECLLDPQVGKVVAIGRSGSAQHNAKFQQILLADMSDFAPIESELAGFDACFFCLGISSAGLSEASYRRVTYDFTLAAAKTLARLNPQMTFVYVSGAGTDASGSGRVMWARVKGQTENALLALPFKAAYMLRPGVIQPLNGIQSKTRSYRILYTAIAPLLPLLRAALPNQVTSTARMGQTMLRLAKRGYAKRVLEMRDINALSAPAAAAE
jgi:uncharacterized protein YbjT (DUF2867 family)